MAETLRAHPGLRPVVAACSPREHADTFAKVCEEAGVNPYLMSRANVREQCAWVTPDKAEATAKAAALLAAAVSRTALQEPLTPIEVDCETSVLVVGAGIAGMTAALLIADSGRDVVVVEREPAIGGKVVLMGEVAPDMDCAPCMLEPLMDSLLHHPHIEVLTSSVLEDLLGYLGNYTALVHRTARHVDVSGCYGCGSCAEACPVEYPDPFGAGLGTAKAIQVPFTGALPNASRVDESVCLHFNGGTCDACVAACPFGNVDLAERDEVVERHVGAVIVATGSEIRCASATDTAFEMPCVVTTWAFERMLNPDGPTGGQIRLPDGTAPASIALVHCADESGGAPAKDCSGTCCLALAKHAAEIGHKLPEAQLVEFVWDRRQGGEHYRGIAGADRAGRLKPVEVRMGADDTLRVVAAETGGAHVCFTRAGKQHRVGVDLVVLAPPHAGTRSAVEMAGRIGIDVDGNGYVRSAHQRLRSFSSRVEGVYVAGSAQGEKDIGAATAQAAGAAGAVMSALVPGRTLVREAATAAVDETRCGACRICVLSCPYQAVSFDGERRVAVVNALLCHGCGTCAACCPSSAITARHFSDAQILAEIRTLSEGHRHH
jgi:heterodisulfide reductase subunit A